MFQLRDSKSVLVNQISSFLPDMLKARGYTNWRSPKGGRQKDNRQIIKKILETCLNEADAILAMEVVESCRSASSTVAMLVTKNHYQSGKSFYSSVLYPKPNIEMML